MLLYSTRIYSFQALYLWRGSGPIPAGCTPGKAIMKIRVLSVERVHPVRRNGIVDTSVITADGVRPQLGFFQCVLQ